MDVPTKLKWLGFLQRWFPTWALTLKAKVIEHAFDADLADAEQRKDWAAREEISRQQNYEASEYWNQLEEVRSRKLIRRARKCHISCNDVKWQQDQYGNQYLDDASASRLHREVNEETRRTWSLRIQVIGAITGLVGATIGVISLLLR